MHSSGSSDFPSMMWPGVEGVCVCVEDLEREGHGPQGQS